MYLAIHVKYRYSCQILIKLEISRTLRVSTFLQIRSVEVKLFLADGQTAISKLMVAFRNLANAPKN